jgi:hypothetical protein
MIKMATTTKMTKLPVEAMAFFREQRRIGGKMGGKIGAENMTATQRKERARLAGIASGEARRKAMEAKEAEKGRK